MIKPFTLSLNLYYDNTFGGSTGKFVKFLVVFFANCSANLFLQITVQSIKMNETHLFKKQTTLRIERMNNASVENIFIIRAIHFRLIRENW